MKKMLLLGALLSAVYFADGAEYLFDTQASCELQGKAKLEFKNGCHILKGNCHFWPVRMFKHDPAKKYSISAEFMTDCEAPYPSFMFGLVYFDDKGKFIQSSQYLAAPGGFTELAKPVGPSDTTITIKKPAGFRKHAGWAYVLAFEAREDNSDLPNPKVSTNIKKMDIGTDTITLTLAKPIFAACPAGTKVRLHYSLSFFHPVNLNQYYIRPNTKWQKIEGTISIPRGVKNFKPALIFYHSKDKKYVYIRNFKLIEE